MKIAMWSGPRNLSTAMMYSFGARSDCAVWDEPFYAPYLAATGLDHPMRDEIIAAHESDPVSVARQIIDSNTGEKPHFYMKHMPHHMIDGVPMDWAKDCVNIHLIRHPARVIASYGAKRDQVTADDVGFRQQWQVYQALDGHVIDSFDIRQDPQVMLEKLCDAIGLAFDPAMLSWPAGGRKEDGIWAAHWYGAIHASTGFAGPEGPLPTLGPDHTEILNEALPYYEKLHALRLAP